MSFEFIPVWKNITPELEAELVDFWIDNKAIGDKKQAALRSKQVVCIVREDGGKIVGVSTAHPRVIPRLRQPMFYYRNFIAADYRGKQLAGPFLEKSKAALQEHTKSLPKPICLGILIELENKGLAAHRNEAVWPEAGGTTFIGYSPKGLHLRVSYFDDAKLGAPMPVRRQAVRGGGQQRGQGGPQAGRGRARQRG